jgi:hypothetical protein
LKNLFDKILFRKRLMINFQSMPIYDKGGLLFINGFYIH